MLQQARVTRYNCLSAQPIVTCHRGVGGIFRPWGKGLKKMCDYIFDLYVFVFFKSVESISNGVPSNWFMIQQVKKSLDKDFLS